MMTIKQSLKFYKEVRHCLGSKRYTVEWIKNTKEKQTKKSHGWFLTKRDENVTGSVPQQLQKKTEFGNNTTCLAS